MIMNSFVLYNNYNAKYLTQEVALFGCGLVVGAYLTWGYLLPKGGRVKSDHAKLDRFLMVNDNKATSSNNNEGNDDNGLKKKKNDEAEIDIGTLDLRRKAYIVHGGAFDLHGHVVVYGNDGFDLQKTIFGNIEYKLRRIISDKIGVTFFWTEIAQQRIALAYEKKISSSIPAASLHVSPCQQLRSDKALCDFMKNECNFAMEHADGSFMDHLRFCFEYSYMHFKQYSPRVLLLHSIMGVGTNFFPMSKEKIPLLQSLVTEFEFEQISIFPSVLRLLYHGPLIDELLTIVRSDNVISLDKLDKIVFHRVIDNERITITSEAFWIQLNYQLMHLLDFIPIVSWKENLDDPFLQNFTLLYELLTMVNKLMCTVDFQIQESLSSSSTGRSAGQRMTLQIALMKIIPKPIALKLARNGVKNYSKQIGHSLNYELLFIE